MRFLIILTVFVALCVSRSAQEECGPERFSQCMENIYNVTYGHEHGLFQNGEDLYMSCPVIKQGISCIQDFAKECGTEMIAEDFKDQFESPMALLEKICIPNSELRAEYVRHSKCMLEHAGEFAGCTEKLQEFLTSFEADSEEKEKTMSCLYDMMFRSCLMSTATNSCGIEAGSVVRKILQYTPISGLKMCFPDRQLTLS